MLPYAELALHEFCSFEFVNESRTMVHPLEFASEASSNAYADGMALANSTGQVSGTSEALIDGQTVIHSIGSGEGVGSFTPSMAIVLLTNYGIEGRTIPHIRSAYKTGVTFWGGGVSEVEFFYFEGNEFHIRPRSSVIGVSGADVGLFFNVNASSEFKTVTQAINNTEAESENVSEIVFNAQRLTHTQGSIASAASIIFHSYRGRVTAFVMHGGSEGLFQGQLVENLQFNGEGTSNLILPADYKVLHDAETAISGHSFAYFGVFLKQILASDFISRGLGVLSGTGDFKEFHPATYRSEASAEFLADGSWKQYIPHDFLTEGTSNFLAEGGYAEYLVFNGDGSSSVVWFRGRNTLPFIDPSYVVFIRPEENRTLVWKE